ncbi:fungal protein [Schizosaccharomyces japonicus yFS275]|uniref:Fungal protein n=1 Tax=Schizosaccharomyces japonicus (strain yFS275 / FY16936) TaxID=402676 RepID=B6K6Z9_SCHJY|nr:fungal protein [Schizosaccharomyces japonicus yFS275]EEB09303.1 fungal protein [Schizosaccharomyces japonicus yFS275]
MEKDTRDRIRVPPSSFLGFNTEFAKEKAKFLEARKLKEHNSAAGNPNRSLKRIPLKKDIPVSHQTQSKKLKLKHAPDVTEEELRKSKEALEHKAKLYDDLVRHGGPNVHEEEQGDTEMGDYLVDFTKKWAESNEGENEQMEIVDEFGRTRKVSIFEAGSTLLDQSEKYKPEHVIYGDYMPEFHIPEETMREIWSHKEKLAEHYDASKEVRSKGVGFYQFSLDEMERQKQFESLAELRQQTIQVQEMPRTDTFYYYMRHLEERKERLRQEYNRRIGENWLDTTAILP